MKHTKGDTKQFWFPTKQYGWGWGLPTTWQGQLVMGAFFVLLIAGLVLFPPATATGSFMVYVTGLCVILVGICYLKGEPPSWRWGHKG